MDKRQDLELVYFFGRIIASYSHEIRNVLAVINETTGLMNDLLTYVYKDQSEKRDKLINLLVSVTGQLQRGEELSTCLNTFAHAPDKAENRIDVTYYLDTLVKLSTKIAARRNLELQVKEKKKKLFLNTSPIEFLATVFSAVDCCFLIAGDRATIILDPEQQQEGMTISCKCSETEPSSVAEMEESITSSDAWEKLNLFLERTNCSVTLDLNSNQMQLSFAKSACSKASQT